MDEKEFDKLTKLCRISCTEIEKTSLSASISSVLEYVGQLQEVDTQGVEPCFTVLETLTNVLRDDTPGDILSREAFLENAPSHVGGMVRVPPVIVQAGLSDA